MIAQLNTRQPRLRRAAIVPAVTFGLLISGCGSLAAHGLTALPAQPRSLRPRAPVRYWSSATILASCAASQGSRQLWLVPVSGARPAALTPVRNGHGRDLGDVGAWQLDRGLYLQALGACGDQFIARQHADGSVSAIGVPGAPANDNRIIAAAGGRLLILALTGCQSSNSLLWFNPGTRAEQWLVKAPLAVQGVSSVVPYFSTQNQNGLY